jgi:hypothetical protein
LLSLLLELALFVTLRQLTRASWLLVLIGKYRLQRHRMRRQTEDALRRARADDRVLRNEIQTARRRIERKARLAAASADDG